MAGPEPAGGIALVTCADDDLSRLSSPAPTRSPMLTHTGLVRQPRARIRRAPGIRAHRPGHTAGRDVAYDQASSGLRGARNS